jgi:hypothetical protein
MDRIVGRARAASAVAVAVAVALASCGSNSSGPRDAATTRSAPAALIVASNGFIASVERKHAAAVCAYFTARGRAYIVADAHSAASCSQVLATEFTRGTSILDHRPANPAQVTRVQNYGADVILSYRGATGRGDTIPWVKTSLGWKVDRTG